MSRAVPDNDLQDIETPRLRLPTIDVVSASEDMPSAGAKTGQTSFAVHKQVAAFPLSRTLDSVVQFEART
jgi:hypothetical protein